MGRINCSIGSNVHARKSNRVRKWTGPIRLFFVLIVIAVVWLLVLPWVATRPSTRERLRRLDSRGIDPAAMFYTELPPEIFLDSPGR